MIRRRLVILVMSVCTLFATPVVRGVGPIADHKARGFGLQRAWFSHAPVDTARSRVVSATLEGNHLFVLTSAGVVQSIDATTGKSEWIVNVGNPDYPSLGPAASANFVAVINGSSAYVLRREDGRIEYVKQLAGGPAAGPSVTDRYVFAPLFSGRIEGFNFKEPEVAPWLYASSGRVYTPMVATDENLLWSTDRGYLYVANADAEGVKYRFETSSPIVAAPASRGGQLFAASATGYVYCIQEVSGKQQWRYATGEGITKSPVVVGDTVYVATERPSLFAINAKTGERLWESPGISQVVSVSNDRVYGIDQLGTVSLIDAKTGIVQGRLATSPATVAVLNEQTDRLFLVSETGLVQCLHEVALADPLMHREQKSAADAPAAATSATDDESTDLAPASPPAMPPTVNPFDSDDAGDDADDAPVNPFDDLPGADPFGGEGNPFSF